MEKGRKTVKSKRFLKWISKQSDIVQKNMKQIAETKSRIKN